MSKYRLRPHHTDLLPIKLGSNLRTIEKNIKTHLEDIIEFPMEYEIELVKAVEQFLKSDNSTVTKIGKNYNLFIGNKIGDYIFEKVY